ncbi:MAG: 16S rRNA (guanine(966)-N(2))-methyltransferase RsmD [Alphaproteobacteria bacterium]|nr:16S rRNA (guanine(966)-N(2))-methyltransferase RsmD [Alphaproteobacteria bacterium]
MRIVGGKFRGLTLAAPKDDRVRPTSDRVREALFNILAHNDFGTGFRIEGARVLDLFSGTGALGLEALSRGAKYVLFVDDHAESRGLVRRNVEAMNATGATKIWRRDATGLGEMPPNAGGPFDLVFLDPPYRKDLVRKAMAIARAGKWLTDTALIVAEMAEDENFIAPSGFALLDERDYGQTKVLVMRADAP